MRPDGIINKMRYPGVENFAFSAATTMSQEATNWQPAAAAVLKNKKLNTFLKKKTIAD